MRTAIGASIPLFLAASAGPAQTQWVDPSGGVWNDAANWSPMDVPLAPGESAQIATGGAYSVTVASVSPEIDALLLTNPDASLGINSSRTLLVGALHNDGLIVINANALSGASALRITSTGVLSGAGRVVLNRFGGSARLETSAGVTATNGSGHTIEGLGEVRAALVNEGVVRANAPGQTLLLTAEDKTNHALMEGAAGGELRLHTLTLTQGPAGVLRADGGSVVFDVGDSPTVVGGHLETVNGGTMFREASGTTTLRDVTNAGTLGINGSGVVEVTGAGLNNEGVVLVNDNNSSGAAVLRLAESGTLAGGGRVVLNRFGGSARLETSTGATATNGTGHTVEGLGEIRAALVNEGAVRANVTGQTLWLANQDKTNNGLMEAGNGGELGIYTLTLTQGPAGVLRADGGAVVFDIGDSPTIVGGRLETVNGGTMVREASGTTTLRDVTNLGTLGIDGSGVVEVAGAGLTNEGVVLVNDNNSSGAAILRVAENGTLAGSGRVVLNRFGGSARLETSAGVTATNSPPHTIEGLGEIRAALVNEGLVRAGVPGQSLMLAGEGKTNNGLMEASNGGELGLYTLTLTQGPTGVLRADGGAVVFDIGDSPTIVGGRLETVNGGTMVREASGTTTLDGVTSHATIGVHGSGTLALGAGGMVNEGRIVVNSNDSGGAAFLRFASTATMSGSGSVSFERSPGTSRLVVADGAVATFGPGVLLSGNGRFDGEVRVLGAVTPGLSIGSMEAFGSLTLEPSATLEIEAADSATHDTVEGFSAFTAAGTVRVVPINGYQPALGDSLTIVEAASVSGEFDVLDAPPVGSGLEWRLRYDSDAIVLVVSCSADYNVDGAINTLDVLAFLNDWVAGDPGADINGDGSVNTLDVLAFLNLWTGGC